MNEKILGLLVLFLLASCTQTQEKEETESASNTKTSPKEAYIAIGSCNQQNAPQEYWNTIGDLDPSTWIWLGDIIYGDSEDPMVLEKEYIKQAANTHYANFVDGRRVYGIWDDHDYGLNNAGKEYSIRKESRDLLFDFLQVPSAQYQKEGAYQAYNFEENGTKVHLILLDARYFRDPVEYKNRKPQPNSEGTILGDQQWTWLEDELASSEADILLIASGIQVIPEDHPYEKWANFPNERKKLLDLVSDQKDQVAVLLSGDRHLAELSSIDWKEKTIYELTASGLTHSYSGKDIEFNQHRKGKLLTSKNFGCIVIPSTGDSLRLELRTIDGKLFEKLSLSMRKE